MLDQVYSTNSKNLFLLTWYYCFYVLRGSINCSTRIFLGGNQGRVLDLAPFRARSES